jgi:hypothetical protein
LFPDTTEKENKRKKSLNNEIQGEDLPELKTTSDG